MKYSLVMRGNPRYPERGKKCYASAQVTKTLSLKEFVDGIVMHGSSYNKGDYKAIISYVVEELVRKLKDGYKVDLCELGKFYPTLECEGAPSMDEFSPDRHIKGIRVNWEPSDEFLNLRQGVEFQPTVNRRHEKRILKATLRGDDKVEL